MGILSSREIGEKLRELRKRRGLTQEQLAELVDVTFQQIQKYENGSNRLNTDKLQAITQALDVPIQSLFGDDCREERLLSDNEMELVRKFRMLPNSEIQNYILTCLLQPPSD